MRKSDNSNRDARDRYDEPRSFGMRGAMRIIRDLLGSAAIGSALTCLAFGAWLGIQFETLPKLARIADAATTLLWILTAIYAAQWLLRGNRPGHADRGAAAGSRSTFAPLIRASGNAALLILGIGAGADLLGATVDRDLLYTAGYGGLTTVGLAIDRITRGRAS